MQVYLNVNLITKSGSIGVGRVNMQISGHEFGKMRKVEERIEKCPDKNARISMGVTVEFIKKYTKAHEDVA